MPRKPGGHQGSRNRFPAGISNGLPARVLRPPTSTGMNCPLLRKRCPRSLLFWKNRQNPFDPLQKMKPPMTMDPNRETKNWDTRRVTKRESMSLAVYQPAAAAAAAEGQPSQTARLATKTDSQRLCLAKRTLAGKNFPVKVTANDLHG